MVHQSIRQSIQRFYQIHLLRFRNKTIRKILGEFHEPLSKNPVVLVDGGASGGLMANFMILQNHLKTVGFEPDEAAYSALAGLNSDNTLVINRALYNKNASVDFYTNRNPVTSSLLKPNKEFLSLFPNSSEYDSVKTTRLNATTIDEALISNGIPEVDFIKLDTQGSELFILEGGRRTLSTCFGLEIEVEFCPVYQDQPLFGDVDHFLRERGFVLFDLRPVYWKRTIGLKYGKPKGQLAWADVLYFKDSKRFHESIQTLDNSMKFQKTLHAALISVLYGYLDFALELTDWLKGTVRDGQIQGRIEVLERALKKKYFANFLPRLPIIRNLIAGLFHYPYKMFRTGFEEHSIFERDLGNL